MALKELVKQEIQINEKKKLVLTVSWCKACGICMQLCPRKVLGEEDVTKKVLIIAPEQCNGCGVCELSCPDFVFTIEETEEDLA
jgi:2-oxoglutarate ferredoxin oxidoreductase subunit delta